MGKPRVYRLCGCCVGNGGGAEMYGCEPKAKNAAARLSMQVDPE